MTDLDRADLVMTAPKGSFLVAIRQVMIDISPGTEKLTLWQVYPGDRLRVRCAGETRLFALTEKGAHEVEFTFSQALNFERAPNAAPLLLAGS